MKTITLTSLGLLATAAGTSLALPPFEAEPPKTETVYVIEAENNEPVVVELLEGVTVGQNGEYHFTAAQPDAPKHRVRVKADNVTAKHAYVVSSSDDNESFVIKIENGTVVDLKHNGQDVPKNLFKFNDGVVVILNADGKVLTEHNIHAFGPDTPTPPGAPHAQRVMRFGQGGNFVFDQHTTDKFFTDNAGNQVTWDFKPRVMVGINQGVPSAALRHHLNIQQDQPCILIERVIEGLPAARAGLQQFDVVIKTDGKNADDGVLRGILSDKDPGENVTFEVIRKGEPMQIVVELAEFDSERLSPNVQFFGEDPDENVFVTQVPSPSAWNFTNGGWKVGEPGVTNAPHPVREFRFDSKDFEDPEKLPEAMRHLIERIELNAGNVQFDGNRVMFTDGVAIKAEGARIHAERAEIMADQVRAHAEGENRVMGNVRRFAPAASTDRLDELEARLDQIEESLADRLERLFDRLDSISEQLQEAASDS